MTDTPTIKPELLDQLLSGSPAGENLLGEGGLFRRLKKALLERALDADAAGGIHMIGDGTPPRISMRLRSRHIGYTLAFNPSLSVGEAYMDGLIVIEEGSIYDFLEVLARNYTPGGGALGSPRLSEA